MIARNALRGFASHSANQAPLIILICPGGGLADHTRAPGRSPRLPIPLIHINMHIIQDGKGGGRASGGVGGRAERDFSPKEGGCSQIPVGYFMIFKSRINNQGAAPALACSHVVNLATEPRSCGCGVGGEVGGGRILCFVMKY